MNKIPDIHVAMVLTLTVCLPLFIALYDMKYSVERKSVLTLTVLFSTTFFSLIAVETLGTHDGYWVIAILQVFALGNNLIGHALKDSPDITVYFQPWMKIAKCLGVGMLACLHLVIFWSISFATGIAVQYVGMPFKF